MKNVSKNNNNNNKKVSSCFRPVVDIDAMLDPPSSLRRSSSFRFSCVHLPPKHHPPSFNLTTTSLPHPDDSVVHPPPKRNVSLLFKALAIQTILNIRARRRTRQGSKRRSSGDERAILNQATADSNTPETKADTESENSSKAYPKKPDHKGSRGEDESEKEKKSACFGIFVVVVSLAFTVVWGKCWGAFLTSTWLCFLSLGKAGKLWPRKSKREGQMVENRSPGI